MDELTEKLFSTTDAQVWTEEFLKSVKAYGSLDEGLVLTWFANAMEVAKDSTRHLQAKAMLMILMKRNNIKTFEITQEMYNNSGLMDYEIMYEFVGSTLTHRIALLSPEDIEKENA